MTAPAPLTGEALKQRNATMQAEGYSTNQIAIECGYYNVVTQGKFAGQTRAKTAAFQQALLEAAGLVAKRPTGGKTSSFKVARVGASGRAPVSAATLQAIKAGPGTVFNVEIAGPDTLVLTVTERHWEEPEPQVQVPTYAPGYATPVGV